MNQNIDLINALTFHLTAQVTFSETVVKTGNLQIYTKHVNNGNRTSLWIPMVDFKVDTLCPI